MHYGVTLLEESTYLTMLLRPVAILGVDQADIRNHKIAVNAAATVLRKLT
jgi:hypothetical protein